MSIRTQMETIAGQLTQANTFIFGLTGWQNLEADESATFPIVFLDSPITSEDDFKQGGYVEVNYKLNLMFAYKTDLADTQPQQDVAITNARLLAREFVLRIKAAKDSTGTHLFRNVKNTRRTDFQNMFDVNVSGCILELSLEPIDESSVCV